MVRTRIQPARLAVGDMVRPRILIVDNDKWLAQRLSYGLFQAGCHVFIAQDAECAARVALRERPDLILLEMELPRYSGLEFHECLQYAERGRGIPVIYVTGSDSPVLRRAAQKLGARGFLKKPLGMDRVLQAIRLVLPAQRGLKQLVPVSCPA